MQSTPSLPLLPGSLWPGVVVPDRVLFPFHNNNDYNNRHEFVWKMIHCELCKKFEFENPSWGTRHTNFSGT